jgi:hypothetical protein
MKQKKGKQYLRSSVVEKKRKVKVFVKQLLIHGVVCSSVSIKPIDGILCFGGANCPKSNAVLFEECPDSSEP